MPIRKLFQNSGIHPYILILIDHRLRFHMMRLIWDLWLRGQFGCNSRILVIRICEVVILESVFRGLNGSMSKLVTFSSIMLCFSLFLEMTGACFFNGSCFEGMSTWSEGEHLLWVVVCAFWLIDVVVISRASMTSEYSGIGILIALARVIHYKLPIRTNCISKAWSGWSRSQRFLFETFHGAWSVGWFSGFETFIMFEGGLTVRHCDELCKLVLHRTFGFLMSRLRSLAVSKVDCIWLELLVLDTFALVDDIGVISLTEGLLWLHSRNPRR